jgi:plasmid stability protein
MEIHAPEKPILTVKEAAVHLLIVTVGILIALSLEGIVEYVHHRTVVREAREIMRHEVEENRRELDKALAFTKDKQMPQMMHAIDVMNALSAQQTTDTKILLNYEGARLQSAGRATAELMGAFAHMDYNEVGRWAAVYDRQQQFLTLQSAALSEETAAFSFLLKRELRKTPSGQIEMEAETLRRAVGALVLVSQMGVGLRAQYDTILGAH